MHSFRLLRGLGPLDARLVGRDEMLRMMLFLPLLAALPMRFVLPVVLARIGAGLGMDVMGWYDLIGGSALLLLPAIACGTVVGLLLLDMRDDRTLLALRVSPLPLWATLGYRLGLPLLLAPPLSLLSLVIGGMAKPGVLALLPAALAAAPLGAIYALALAAFAANKVQGLALMKATSALLPAPLLALAVPPAWEPLFGLLPTYWPVRAYMAALAGDGWGWALALGAWAYAALLGWWMLRRLRDRAW